MNLKKGQILYINNEKYKVINMIDYEEDTWKWQEYEIESELHVHRWLNVENGENNQLEYWVYDNYNGVVNVNELEFFVDGNKYELYEKGKATVVDYFGNADVDKYEVCDFTSYISQDKKTIISIENWSGEIEKSIGTYIPPESIRITEEIENIKNTVNMNNSVKKQKTITTIIVIIAFLPVFISILMPIFQNIFVNKSIEKYLEKQTSKYTYVTSVTNNTNNEKAKVYQSSFTTIDSTVKDIIDGVPEGITETTDSDTDTEEDGIGLQTNNEYAYVYEEDDKIYIQVSSKKYLNDSGTMYHSSHYHHYYRGYRYPVSSTIYNNYAYSARQKSVNSRTSTGGGTSSGK